MKVEMIVLAVALVAVVVALFAWAAIPMLTRIKIGWAFRRLRRMLLLFIASVMVRLNAALFGQRHAVALANALGLFDEKGMETLLWDINSTSTFASRYLVVMRGATGYQYGDLEAGGASGSYPLGVTPDAPFNLGDPFSVWRFGARPGFMIGIATANAAITIDHLVYAAASGKIADLTLAGNGTYWVIGRAVMTCSATSSTGECAFVPCVPYEITVSNGGGTYAYAGAGV